VLLWERFSVRDCVMEPPWPAGQVNDWVAVRVSVLVCVLGVGNAQGGPQVLLVVVHGAVPTHGVKAL
jgi:hypothetical protein